MKVTIVEAKKPKDRVIIDLDETEACELLEMLSDNVNAYPGRHIVNKLYDRLEPEIGQW